MDERFWFFYAFLGGAGVFAAMVLSSLVSLHSNKVDRAEFKELHDNLKDRVSRLEDK